MEQGTRESQPSHRDLIGHSFGLICMHDLDGVLEWVSPAAARLLGVDARLLVGRRFQELMANPTAAAIYLQHIREQGRDQGWVEALDAEGRSICGIVFDHTLIETRPQPRRPFQGWRYLKPEDAPADLSTLSSMAPGDIPPEMRAALEELALL